MKKLLFAFVFAISACALQPVKQQQNLRTQSSVGFEDLATINLRDDENKVESLNQIKNIFENPLQKISAETVLQKLKALNDDQAYRELTFSYLGQTMAALKLEDVFQWMDQYPKASGVLHNYIDPQEVDEGGDPIWKATNRNLRNDLPLSPSQQKFVTDMKEALDVIPKARAIVYRGVHLKKADFQKYKDLKQVTEKSFVSSSLDPQIAMGFASSGHGDVATVFVIDSFTGRPISFVVPTNMHEMEILIKPGVTFEIVKIVQSSDLKSAAIFLKEK